MFARYHHHHHYQTINIVSELNLDFNQKKRYGALRDQLRCVQSGHDRRKGRHHRGVQRANRNRHQLHDELHERRAQPNQSVRYSHRSRQSGTWRWVYLSNIHLEKVTRFSPSKLTQWKRHFRCQSSYVKFNDGRPVCKRHNSELIFEDCLRTFDISVFMTAHVSVSAKLFYESKLTSFVL